MENIILNLEVALYWSGLKLQNNEDIYEAAELIQMDINYNGVDIYEAINNWIIETKANYPEYFKN